MNQTAIESQLFPLAFREFKDYTNNNREIHFIRSWTVREWSTKDLVSVVDGEYGSRQIRLRQEQASAKQELLRRQQRIIKGWEKDWID